MPFLGFKGPVSFMFTHMLVHAHARARTHTHTHKYDSLQKQRLKLRGHKSRSAWDYQNLQASRKHPAPEGWREHGPLDILISDSRLQKCERISSRQHAPQCKPFHLRSFITAALGNSQSHICDYMWSHDCMFKITHFNNTSKLSLSLISFSVVLPNEIGHLNLYDSNL